MSKAGDSGASTHNRNFTHQFEAVNTGEIDEGINDNPDNVNILADIGHFSSGYTGENAPDNFEPKENDADILQYTSQLNLDEEVNGPRIIEKIVVSVNKLRLQRITQKQFKTNMKRHYKSENVEIRLPKCEQSIWNELPGKARVTDVKFQAIQTALLTANSRWQNRVKG